MLLPFIPLYLTKKEMKFTVDCSRWRAGYKGPNAIGRGDTLLENAEGFMCCLGHCSRQIDPDASIRGRLMPEPNLFSVGKKRNPLVSASDESAGCSTLSSKAADINDDSILTTAQRKAKLRLLFKKHGHTISFTGKTVKYAD